MKITSPIRPDITPAILAYTRTEFLDKAKIAKEKKAKLLHIDVMDGTFVDNRCFCAPKKITAMNIGIPFEAHLMVLHPEKHIAKWADAGARQIIFHIEATDDPLAVIREAKRCKVKVWVAINPKTKVSSLDLIFSSIYGIVVMGVQPGRGGQRFRPSVLKKVEYIRKMAPNVPIAVDGGVRASNAGAILAAGANRLIAGSYFYDAH